MPVLEAQTTIQKSSHKADYSVMNHKPNNRDQAGIRIDDVEKLVDSVIAEVGKHIVLGLPLAIGKPIAFVNALYLRAKADPSITLQIETGISLELPKAKTTLEQKFLGPFVEREFSGVPELLYIKDLRTNSLPDNITVFEFFFKAGSFLNSAQQLNYTSTNYTHAVRDLLDKGVNVVAQLMAERVCDGVITYSLSSNSDLALDMMAEVDGLRKEGRNLICVAEINSNLPFMRNDAEVGEDLVDFVLTSQPQDYPLFAVPEAPISNADHMIGFYASNLVKDGGTLQLGIGSLCSAMTHSLLMRHKNNVSFNQVFDDLKIAEKFPIVKKVGQRSIFTRGLYGCSELMVDGFMHLYQAGILSRQVFSDATVQTLLNNDSITTNVDINTLICLLKHQVISAKLTSFDLAYLQKVGIFKPEVSLAQGTLTCGEHHCTADLSKQDVLAWIADFALGKELLGGTVMHGAFFIGPKTFYKALHDLTESDHAKFCMTSVKYVNDLYDHFLGDERIKQLQRKEARFVNSAMMVTLDGSVVSDALESGQVVSGVGGQYNFVAQSHQLRDSRSIIKLHSCCVRKGKLQSNVLFNYGHTTIPRQLRDIVVTEYGIADLRGKPDHIVYTELIKIADSRFQPELLQQAKAAGKIAQDYALPVDFTQNYPESINAICDKYRGANLFPKYPHGSSFTETELKIVKALKALASKGQTKSGKLKLLLQAVTSDKPTEDLQEFLQRMSLHKPQGFTEWMTQRLLSKELKEQH